MSVEIELRWGSLPKPTPTGFVGTWRTWDIEFLRSQKAMAKTRRGLSNLPYNFNILVLLESKRKRAEEAREAIKIDLNAINVVYTNNVTTDANWIPMTPWIMVHRIAHGLMSSRDIFTDDFTSLEGPEATIFFGLEKLWHDCFGEQPEWSCGTLDYRLDIQNRSRSHGSFSCMGNFNPAIVGFMSTYFFTMKSARERMISNELDIFAEAFAQYLITGRFKLRRFRESGIEEVGHTDNYIKNPCAQTDWGHGLKTSLVPKIPVEEIDACISLLEQDINARMKKLADRLVGRVVAF